MVHNGEHDVVVIGAGLAGLATTAALASAGHDIVCLEARKRIGGRLLTVTTPDASRGLDLGATWFWEDQQRVASLVTRLGIDTFDQYLAGDTLLRDAREVRRLPGNLLDVPARRFTGGAHTLPIGLAAELPTGTVHLDAPVSAVERRPTGGLVVHTPDAVFSAEHVVVAIPPALALTRIEFDPVLPADLARLARQTPIWMGATVKVVARYGTTFWRAEGLAGAAASRTGPLQEVHDMSGPDGRPAALLGFAPARVVGSAFERTLLAQLVEFFGEHAGRPDALHIQNWSHERWTVPPNVDRLTDNRLLGHHSYQLPALDGRLHWASTETSPEHPGHIEGALAAAERATNAVLSASRPHSTPPPAPR